MPSRVTIDEVAKAAGVTKGTVSRVLSGKYPVSAQVKAAVFQAVTDLGYVPSARARALATGKSETIAVVLSEPLDYLFDDPTFSLLMKGIADEMAKTRYAFLLLQAHSNHEVEKALKLITNQAVDAVIHLSPWSGKKLLDSLTKQKIPVVLCGQTDNPKYLQNFSVVYADDVTGAQKAASHLHSCGVVEPVAIVGSADQPAARDRIQGYQDIYPNLDPARIVYSGWSEQDGVQAVECFLEKNIAFDGVLAGSDRVARGVITVLRARNIDVPAQVKVIGYDDHKLARDFSPPLTTIHQPMYLQGKKAFQMALELLNSQHPRVEILATKLMVRATS